jgi:HPt (histidine-containing phosphotransfer) domain-containing protein
MLTNQKCINLEYLTLRTKSNPKLMMEMIHAYLEQTPPLIETMTLSLQNEDWELLKSSVHKMIPSFSIMGLSQDVEEMARKVQDTALAHENIDEINNLVLQLENNCNQACKELEIEFNNLKNKN